MNSRIRILLAGAACFAGCAFARAQAPGPSVVAEDQMMGPAPSPAYVWMAGHWNSDAGQWKWIAGHWDLPPTRSSVWVQGHWVQKGDGWAWMNGAWNVAGVAQSPSAPPQPPMANGTPAQAGQAVPMPSTPAPGVAGQYAPGQVPVMDQPPMTTDYPPVEYDTSTAYPGYYWAGDPWAWGLYPALALGFGWWGPGWGYGHGYYGHGYYGHGYYGHGNWGHGNWGHVGSGVRVGAGFHGH